MLTPALPVLTAALALGKSLNLFHFLLCTISITFLCLIPVSPVFHSQFDILVINALPAFLLL